MQGIEPAPGLVHAFGNEIGRGAKSGSIQAPQPLLGIRHGTRIEPDVDQIALADHLPAGRRYQVNSVHIRTVKVYLVVVLQAHVGRIEAFVLERMGRHDAGGDSLFDLFIQFFHRADALLLLSVFRAPDGQRRAPVAAAGKIPILDVLQPLAETAGSRGGGLPGDFPVQGHHLLFYGRCLDEPAVQRIVQDRKVCTPAVRIAVHVFLHLEGAAVGLHHDAKVDIQRAFFIGMLEILLVAGFHITAGIFLVGRIHRGGIGRVHIFQAHEAALAVHLGLRVSILVNRHHRADAGRGGHPLVIRTEGGSDMDDARTLIRGHIIPGNHAECVPVRTEPRDELPVAQSDKFTALDAAREQLMFHLGPEESVHAGFGHDIRCLRPGIRIGRPHLHIVDVGTHAQRRIGRKGPGRGSPGQEVEILLPFHPELNGGRSVAHVLVAAGLIEFVGTEAGAVRGRIRLNGVSLVQETLVIDFPEKVPQRLDVTVVVGDVRVVHIHPVSYPLRHVHPLLGVFHHLLAAGGVIFLHRHLRADVGLGDTQFLFDAQFHGKSVGVPSGATGYPVAGLRLVPADGILDGTGHHMMDARHAVGGRRAFEKNERRGSFTNFQRFLKRMNPFPSVQDLFSGLGQIQPLIFFESHIFYLILHSILRSQR